MYQDSFNEPFDDGERRRGLDRRRHSAVTLLYTLHGRRSLGRRTEDQSGTLVDRHEPRYLLVVMMIFGLCFLDAFFTLMLIDSGVATEANPVMRWAMRESHTFFWFTKLLLTAFALMTMLALKNFYILRMVKVSYLLYGTLALYLVLIKYELWLFHI